MAKVFEYFGTEKLDQNHLNQNRRSPLACFSGMEGSRSRPAEGPVTARIENQREGHREGIFGTGKVLGWGCMMSLVDWMFRTKPKGRTVSPVSRGGSEDQVKAAKAAVDQLSGDNAAAERFPKLTDGKPEVLTLTQTVGAVTKDSGGQSANIWDMEDEPVSVAAPAPARAPVAETAPPRRAARNKTRVLGFDPQAASVVPLFDEGRSEEVGQPAAAAKVASHPTGWLVVIAGPGRGNAFSLMQGVSQIGRGSDQTVPLDFGDMTISRQNHAAIAYDPMTHQFHCGHGGKTNLVRLNGKPLLSTELMKDGDTIQIGETTLLLKVLCTPAFNWSQSEAGGDGHDMAIA